MTDTVIIIPARFGSTRLPGKPLIAIAGKALIERAWSVAQMVTGVSGVYVATDDKRIADAVTAFGGTPVLTPEACRNGTERALAAIDALNINPHAVINLQGDAPLTPPWVIQSMVDEIASGSAEICTPATTLTGAALAQFLEEKKTTPTSGTTLVMNASGEALYFSKAVLPHSRQPLDQVYRHVGLYAYRTDILRKLCALPESPLEQAEKLEQLRALENGFRIKVTLVDYQGRSHASVDTPEDVIRVETIIGREGEFDVG